MGKHPCYVTVSLFVQILRKGTAGPGRSIFGFFLFVCLFWGTFILISIVAELDCVPTISLNPLSPPFLYRDDHMCSCVCVFPVWAPQVPDMLWLSPVSQDSAESIVGSGYLWALLDSFSFLFLLSFSKTKVLDRLTQWPQIGPAFSVLILTSSPSPWPVQLAIVPSKRTMFVQICRPVAHPSWVSFLFSPLGCILQLFLSPFPPYYLVSWTNLKLFILLPQSPES